MVREDRSRGDFLLTRPRAGRCIVLECGPVGSSYDALGRQSAGGWAAGHAIASDERGYCGLILVVTHDSDPYCRTLQANNHRL